MANFNGFVFTNLSSADTLSNPDTFTTPTNAFDDNDVTLSSLTTLSVGTIITKTLGATYASRTVTVVRILADLDMGLGSVTYAGSIVLQGFNGTSWVNLTTLGTTTTQTLSIDTLVRGSFLSQGLRLQFNATTDSGLSAVMNVYSISYGTSYTYTAKPLLTALGGTPLESLSDRTAISEDHTLTWNNILTLGMSGIVVNAYRTLQANNVFVNGVNLVTDEFLTTSGTSGTVNTTTSTARYNTSSLGYESSYGNVAVADTLHDPDLFTNPTNAFDNNIATSAIYTGGAGVPISVALGQIFTSQFIAGIRIYALQSTPSNIAWVTIVLESYDGATWTPEATLASGINAISYNDAYTLKKTVSGLRLKLSGQPISGLVPVSFGVYLFQYSNFSNGTLICDTNTLTLDGTEITNDTFIDATIPANTSITVDISDGATTIARQTFNSKNLTNPLDVSSLGAGAYTLTFNINTTDNVSTALLKGFSSYIQ